jgi:hypothetical protein
MAIPGGRKRLSLTAISVVTEVTESLRVGSASRRRAIMRSRQIPVRWETDKRGLIDLPNPGDTCGARVFLTEAARRDVLYRSATPGLRRSRLSKYGAHAINYNAVAPFTCIFTA